MKIIVKSHKRNGRIVKSHMRKGLKRTVKSVMRADADPRDKKGTHQFYKNAIKENPKTGAMRTAIFAASDAYNGSHDVTGTKLVSKRKKKK